MLAGERVQKDKLGWVLDINNSVDEIFNKIIEISKSKDEYEKIKKNFKNYKFKTVTDMQNDYKKIYNTKKYTSIIDDKNLLDMNANTYMNLYNEEFCKYKFLIDRFEKVRNTSIWKVAKKIKSRIIKA